MKKILLVLFCLIAICTNAFATPTLTLEGGNTSPGNTIKLALTLSTQGNQVSSISTDITYDSNLFESVIPEIGPAGSSAGKKVQYNDLGGKIIIAIFSMSNSNVINDGVVAYLNLTVKSTATGVTSLSNAASGADTNDNDIFITGNIAKIFLNMGYKILTSQSPSITVLYGEYIKVFGSAGVNTINVESGGRVECVNFPGENVINIVEDSPSYFTVYRSGATVYLESADTGTWIKIPATKTAQQLCFADGCYNLIISNGKVMIGTKEIVTTETQL